MIVRNVPLISFIAAPRVLGSKEATTIVTRGESQLRDFIANGAITRIQAIGKAEGFELHAHIGSATAALANARGVIRTFGSLNTLTGLIKRLGASSFDVEIRDFEVLPRSANKSAKAD